MSDSEKIRKIVFSRNLPNGEVYYYEEEFLTEPGSRGETSLGDRLIAMSAAGSNEIVATCTYRGVPRGGLLRKIPAENHNGYQLVGDMTSLPAGAASVRPHSSAVSSMQRRTREQAHGGSGAAGAGGDRAGSSAAAEQISPSDEQGCSPGTAGRAMRVRQSYGSAAGSAASRAAADLDAWSRTDEASWKDENTEERRPWYYDDDEPMEEDEFDARAIYRSNRSTQSPLGADLRGGAHFFRPGGGHRREGQWEHQARGHESNSPNSYTQGNGPMNGTKHNNTHTPAGQAVVTSNGAERTSAPYNRYVSGRYERNPVNSQVVFKDFYTPRDSANASFISARQINPVPPRIKTVPASTRFARQAAAQAQAPAAMFSTNTAVYGAGMPPQSGTVMQSQSQASPAAQGQMAPSAAAPAQPRATDVHPHGYVQDQGHFPIRGVCGIRGHVDAGTRSVAERHREAVNNLMMPDSRGALPVDENYHPSDSAQEFAFQHSSKRQAYSHATSVSRYSYGAEYAGYQRRETGTAQASSAEQIAALKSEDVKAGKVRVTSPGEFASGRQPSQWWRDQKLTERSAQKAFAADHFKQNTRGSYIGTPDEFIPKTEDESRRPLRTVYSDDQLKGSSATVIMGGRDEAARARASQADAAGRAAQVREAELHRQEQERQAREMEQARRARELEEERARQEAAAAAAAERAASQARAEAQAQAEREAAASAQAEAAAQAAAEAHAQAEREAAAEAAQEDKGISTAVARSELKLAPVDPSFADFKTADGSRTTMVEDVPKAVVGNDVTIPGMNVNSSDSTAIISSSAALKDAIEAEEPESSEVVQSTTISGSVQEVQARPDTPAPASYSFGDFKTADGSLADAAYRVPVMSQKQLQARRDQEAREKAEAEERERLERIAAEKKAEEERIAAEKKAEEERIAAEKKAEEERLAAQKAEQERIEAERREAERLEAERKAEEERIAAEKKAEEERLAAQKAEQERIEAERREAERLEAERKAEEERIAAEQKAEEERLAAQKAEQERLDAERREAERLEAERKAEEERLAAEKAELERLEAEQAELEAARKAQEEAEAAQRAQREAAAQAAASAAAAAPAAADNAQNAESEAAAEAPKAMTKSQARRARQRAKAQARAAAARAAAEAAQAQQDRAQAVTGSSGTSAPDAASTAAAAGAVIAGAAAAQAAASEAASKEADDGISLNVAADNANETFFGSSSRTGSFEQDLVIRAEYSHQSLDELAATINGESENHPLSYGETANVDALNSSYRPADAETAAVVEQALAVDSAQADNSAQTPAAAELSAQSAAPSAGSEEAVEADMAAPAGEPAAQAEDLAEVEPSVDTASLVSGTALPEEQGDRQEPGLSSLPVIDNMELEQEPQLNLDSSVVNVDREPSLKDVARVENVQDEEEPVFKDSEAMGRVIDAVSGESIAERDLIFATPTRFVENEGAAEDSRQAMISEAAQSGAAAGIASGVSDQARAAQNAIADAVADSLESEDLLADSFMSDDSGLDYLHTSSNNEGSTARGSSSLANLAAELVDDFDDPFEDSFASSLDDQDK